MIIDFHTHIFPDVMAPKTIPFLEQRAGIDAQTDGTMQGLLASMDASGIHKSVVLPVVTKPSQFDSINRFAKMVNDTARDRLISFGGIHPDCEDYKEKLHQIKDMGMLGIKLHPDYQGIMIDDERSMKVIEYANELGLIILVHAGVDIGLPEPVHCPPDRARRVIDAIHPDKLVLAHYGGWKQWDAVYEYLVGQNVYFDTAFLFDYIERDMFMKIWDEHDKTKILFATDSPWGNQLETVDAVRRLPISETEVEMILSGNAKKLLNL